VVSGTCGGPLTSSSATLGNSPSVSITTQPAGQIVCAGTSVTFTVVASNATGYQWYNGTAPISGANNSTYTTNVAGTYHVVVSGTCGGPLTSSSATLGNSPSVSITTQPASQTNCSGNPVTFTVVASNAASYQWYRNNSLINGARSASYTTSVEATYKVVVTGACGNQLTSNSVTLSASQPPSIVTQPTSQTTCAGVSVSFSVTANNAVTYQWYRNGFPITNANGPTYTTAVTGSYRVVVGGSCGSSVTSTAASLTVNSQPTVAAITGGSTVCVGSTLQLSDETAGGTWNTSNGLIASISTRGLVTGRSGGTVTITYRVGSNCGVTTVSKTVTVVAAPDVANINGASSVCIGSTITLSDASAGGTWHSSNTSVVTISSNGIVTGMARGSATISYTLSNSCGMDVATKLVTVNCSGVPGKFFTDVSDGDTVITKEETPSTFNVTVVPNPSQSFFTLTVQSTTTDVAAYIRVFDMSGRLVDEKRGAIGESIRFGGTLVQGMYVVQVLQGNNLKVVKVIKN
jgi:hypothetical protein